MSIVDEMHDFGCKSQTRGFPEQCNCSVRLRRENTALADRVEALETAVRADYGLRATEILVDWFEMMYDGQSGPSVGRVTDRVERVREWLDGIGAALDTAQGD